MLNFAGGKTPDPHLKSLIILYQTTAQYQQDSGHANRANTRTHTGWTKVIRPVMSREGQYSGVPGGSKPVMSREGQYSGVPGGSKPVIMAGLFPSLSSKGVSMNLDRVNSGKDVPNEINVIIEIPAHSDPVKYELDKETGAMFVDRFMSTAMHYPCNYGYVPHTLSKDGDPVDVLVLTPYPLIPGSVIRCRPVGVLKMTDESGDDAKILAVPVDKLCRSYRHVTSFRDVPEGELNRISHFFEHYKDLDEGKWVRVDGWGDVDEAKQEIMDSIAMYDNAPQKPNF